ncbi:UDP-glycosyltransferase 86A1-like [Salvia divinorum]|uniref:UDP-glycosyltransferase 86A1-like n=1 Tax=Salvia divinorum TaxID=28513 RepID=A0ABD1GZ20_SALDI
MGKKKLQNLAIKLASSGCAVTFVHTVFVHHMLSKADGVNVEEADPFLRARRLGLDIRYATISDGFPPDFDRIVNLKQHWDAVFLDFPSRVDELIGDIIQSDDEAFAHFLVADTFYSWPASIARKYNILNVSFWTQPALVFAMYYHFDLLREKGYLPVKGDEVESKDSSITKKIVAEAFEQVKHADFILINTVHELEHELVSDMHHNQPTYAVGPLNFATDSNHQLAEEIANGLLLSGVHFVWVIHEFCLPHGFEDESKDQGLIVSWCNQSAVLTNPAVGEFLTHCDQPTNRELVVDVWKVGINLCDEISVDRKEVAEKIKQLMSAETSTSLRDEMKKMRAVMLNALDEDGSMDANFLQFLDDLWARAEAEVASHD